MVSYIGKHRIIWNHNNNNNNEDKVNNWNTWTLRFDLKQSNNNNNKQNRPKHNVKPLVKLNL